MSTDDPLKPLPKWKSLKKSSSYDVQLYEDPDTLLGAVTDETQQRFLCRQSSQQPADHEKPQPVPPLPRPPMSKYVNLRHHNDAEMVAKGVKSFIERAMNVKKALRLYNLLLMKRNENLREIITEFNSISCSLDKVQKKTKTIGIAGGTTGAVGGVAAIAGVVMAPMTMGISLIATAVGVGMVASAGGVGAAQAAKAKKKAVTKARVEKLAFQYINEVGDLERCLDFILSGMDELRRHDLPRLQRARVQADAVKMAHLSQSVLTNITRRGSANIRLTSPEKLLKAFMHELDQYFTKKGGQKMKKSNESKFSGRVHLLAENLQDDLDHMNSLWETFNLYV
ncbi:Apolipoprotein L domain-containing protein 1 [Collichthys lucidus]|uniref:Apolipoprotein L domain-containing protein 1 n=1 Tax=Collichthys lucidus TaxID=240159 RepID=A0A4U5VSL5_COLLU|nr:Apolipoprotein L domain-containing protein 1 [Collichthys lucidus]